MDPVIVREAMHQDDGGIFTRDLADEDAALGRVDSRFAYRRGRVRLTDIVHVWYLPQVL
ncbi:hypothetical protein [Streptomyces mirabilis]|uniref:hypothetical protein n=1 Tax=Streptomyces mirabilis TaxID=68239 RepID=UPI00364A8566